MFDLFIKEDCPYCKKVREFMDNNNIAYRKIDIADEASKEALIRIGGKLQVPFLVDNEHNLQMYESEDIIEYLKNL